jgi:transcriptional regulator with XRE-family HTH domain
MKQKQPQSPTDVHVGSRVRMRRLMLDMSQEKLGDALGITFQQVQKYEKGTNRISASRLQHLSHLLKVPVPFFFDGAPSLETNGRSPPDHIAPEEITGFMATRDGLDLAEAFMRIRSIQLRRRIVDLVTEIGQNTS